MAERPATCSSCGKRLSKKRWYYRNGQFFCKKSCAKAAKQKAAAEASQSAAEASKPAAS